jgi:ATP-dependent DNA ligase
VGDVVVFVAVDLLRIDGETLLDVPLLERKRLLDGILVEGPLVRRGIHVKPPIDLWLSTWRSLGFRSLAYKQANSRYRPGEANEDWATASIPRN